LEIKLDNVKEKSKLENIGKEHAAISLVASRIPASPLDLYNDLKRVNQELWDIEDRIRIKERNQEFDQEFIALARSVYQTNDERAEIKKEISLHTGSNFVEEKSYEDYS
jgi:prophage tail gpP-like protein